MSRSHLFVALALLLSGCAKEEPGEMVRGAFYRPANEPPQVRRPTPEDQAGEIMYDDFSMNLFDPNEAKREMAEEEASRTRVTGLSEAVRQAVTLPSVPARTTGGYLQLGAVVTTVNGKPIYADRVLASLEKLLFTEAKQRDERSFKAFARSEIEKQVGLFIRTELEVAAAERNLDPQEKRYASDFTTDWRQRQIRRAGGSLEAARAKAAAEGEDFDERVKEKNREVLVQLYYQKKIFPRVQVSAQDMRQYYNKHRKTQFTEQDQAQFRVIRIDARKTGGVEKAIEKIENLRERAVNGEDFAKMAASVNDDPNLMRLGGNVGWVQRGAFTLEPLEEAVWKLQPGKITEVVRIGDSFYIAKLENRKDGRVRPFEEDEVQRQIDDKLRAEQINARRQVQQDSLRQDAVIYPDPPLINPIVEMAMQKYAQWQAGK